MPRPRHSDYSTHTQQLLDYDTFYFTASTKKKFSLIFEQLLKLIFLYYWKKSLRKKNVCLSFALVCLLLFKTSQWWARRISGKDQEVKITLTVSLVGTELQPEQFGKEDFLLLSTVFYAPAIFNFQPMSIQSPITPRLYLQVIIGFVCLDMQVGRLAKY